MATFEFILILSLVASSLQVFEKRIPIPLAIQQVALGFALSFVKSVPDFQIDPSLAFTIFIPPLVYYGALSSSVRDLSRQGFSISLLSVGLIIATIAGVAYVLHSLTQLPWAACVVIGAMVAPPDADIMTSVIDKLGLPQRVSNVLQGESLTNDAPALVAFRFSLAALVGGGFSLAHVLPSFLAIAGGGVLIGYLFGRGVLGLRSFVHPFQSGSLETAISIFSPFIVFIVAESVHASGVLAVATTGFMIIKNSPSQVSAQVRLQTLTVWQVLIDLLGGFLFVMVGFISTRTFRAAFAGGQANALVTPTCATIAAVLAIRIVWIVFEYRALPFVLPRRMRRSLEAYSWRELIVLSWAGMRGGDTLVAALALPLTLANGAPLPYRLEMTTISLGVLMFTLLVEGLSLQGVIKFLGLHRDYSLKEELNKASEKITRFELKQIERWKTVPKIAAHVAPEVFDNMKRAVLYRRKIDGSRLLGEDGVKDGKIQEDKLELRLIRATRRKLLKMRDNDEICDATLRALTRDLDLQTLRFDEMEEGEYGI